MKILYAGGGTLGSVSPLVAVHQKLVSKYPVSECQSLWIGTKSGPEHEIVEQAGIKFKPIVAGKLRRYFDLRNILDAFKIKVAWHQSLWIIKKFKPDVIVTAGSFVAVPVVWAGWFLRVPCLVHQQDLQPGLANKLMTPFAKKITVALEKSLNDYPAKKTVLVGNPVRTQNTDSRTQEMKFKNNLPTLLVIGGGTGALAINELVWDALGTLTRFCNVIHITGRNKNNYQLPLLRQGYGGQTITNYQLHYKPFEFIHQGIMDIIKKADLVISRAGMSFLTELAYFSKPTIIIPIPKSHQEKNAKYFAEKKAGIYLKQKELDATQLAQHIQNLLKNKNKMHELGQNMHKVFVDYSGQKMIEVILSMTQDA